MKKIKILSKTGLMCLWVLLLVYETTQAQSPYTGMWEGDFMEQFKTVILLDQVDGVEFAGKILMYAGENRIQDDELTKISIENQVLSFYIAAKESSFEGTFNEDNTELKGSFIFPDDSRHPLTVRKYEKDSTAPGAATPSLKERLNFEFPVEELKSDFRDLINKLRKHHPRLYAYTPEVSFENRTNEILANMDSDMDMEEFYFRIAPMVASVACSHTGIRLPRDYQQSLYEQGQFFPLNLFLRDRRAYFISAPGVPGVDLEPGCEVTVINNRPVGGIIDELLTLIPAEGNCMSTRYQELNRDFQSYFHLLDPSEQFLLEYTRAGRRTQIQLDACSYSMLHQNEDVSVPLQPYGFHVNQNPEIGVLEVSSFGIRNMDTYFAFLDSAFQMMRDVPDLILDLRDNRGGHPIFAAQLFSYLTSDNFTYFQRNPDVEEFEPLYNVMEPNALHYEGNLYVLVNGNCLSTTGHLISLLKYYTGAIFIGEEPGSTFSCNDFSIQLRLPHTGMEVNIPRTTFITAVKGFNEEMAFPLDYEVHVSIQDILNESDVYRDLVYDLCDKSAVKP